MRMFVTADPSLRRRKAPNVLAPIVRPNIPYGRTVEIDPLPYGAKGEWRRLLDADPALYVWAGYLSPMPPLPLPDALFWEKLRGKRGIHAAAGGWRPDAAQLNIVKSSNIKTVFIPAYQPGEAAANLALFQAYGVENFIIRAVSGRITRNPDDFVREASTGIAAYLNVIPSKQLIVQLHNEPNLTDEGLGIGWDNGRGFNSWFIRAAKGFRARFPGIKIGFPALSPGGEIITQVGGKLIMRRYAETKFYDECRTAIQAADWFAVHVYWSSADASELRLPVNLWRGVAGNKPIICTEAGPGIGAANITAAAARRCYNLFDNADIPVMQWLLNASGADNFQNAAWDTNHVVVS